MILNIKNLDMFRQVLLGDQWLRKTIPEKFEDLKLLLDFEIRGEEGIKYLIWYLKLGDYKEETRNFVSISGIPSSGKNLTGSGVLKNLPGDSILKFDSISKNALSRMKELKTGKIKTVYYREFRKDTAITEDLKAIFDKDTKKYVSERDEKGQWVVKGLLTRQFGLLTTHSLDWIPHDLKDRCWNLTSDSSYEQSEQVIDFILENEQTKIERELKQLEIDKKRRDVLNGVNRINWNLTPIIPYAKELKPILSNKNIRIRRDVSKLIQLIHIVTLVNQRDRFQKTFYDDLGVQTKTYVISEPHDLFFALKIGKRFFLETIQNLEQVQIYLLSIMDKKGKVKVNKYGTETLDDKGNTIYENYKSKDLKGIIERKFSNESTDYKMKKHTENLKNEGYIEIYNYGQGKAKEFRKIKNFKNLEVDFEVNLEVLDNLTENLKISLKDKTIDMIKEEVKNRGLNHE